VAQARFQFAREAVRLLVHKHDVRAKANGSGENQLAAEAHDFSHVQVQEPDAELPAFGALQARQLDVIDALSNAETLQHGRSTHNQDRQIRD
jgi:hypothetical protein